MWRPDRSEQKKGIVAYCSQPFASSLAWLLTTFTDEAKDGMGSEPTLLLNSGWNTVFKSHSEVQLPTMNVYIMKMGESREGLAKDRVIFRDTVYATPRKLWEYQCEKALCYRRLLPLTFPHGSNPEVTRPLFTLTIIRRMKIFQNIALFIYLFIAKGKL